MSNNQYKEKLRNELLRQRKAISAELYEKGSVNIVKTLLEQPEFLAAETVHCYVSMNSRGEVDTHGLIKRIFSMGKEVVVPVTNFDDGTLSHIRLNSFAELETNKWGVLEPEGGEGVPVEELDLVIVPMVGGDEQCNRIGYGKGFYDRFLQYAACPTVGLIFEQNVLPKLPVEKFDIPLDKIITEQRVIRRN